MFEGDGFGVGLTVQPVDLAGPPGTGGWVPPAERDWHPTRLGELMPVAARGEAGLATEIRRANVADARLWAYRVELVTQLAVHRRADRDRPAGKPGSAAPGWVESNWVLERYSEFLPDEVALIMNFSRGEASRFLVTALTLSHCLRDTAAALADGELNWARARAIAEEVNRLGPDADPHVVATVEAIVLPEAADMPVGRLRARLRAEFVRRDNEAAEKRRRQALKAADVFVRGTGLEGMSDVVTRLPTAAAAAMMDAINGHARAAKAAGDPRPLSQIRAEIQANLTLRPFDTSRPAVTAHLNILAPLNSLLTDPADPAAGGEPTGVAEVGGEPVTAAHLRALLAAVDAICPGGLQTPDRRQPSSSTCSEAAATCWPPSTAPNSTDSPPAAAPTTAARTPDAPARSSAHPRRPMRTRPPRRSGGSCPPATAAAGTPAAATGPAGPIWTTSSRTPRVVPPTARTCAACAAGITA